MLITSELHRQALSALLLAALCACTGDLRLEGEAGAQGHQGGSAPLDPQADTAPQLPMSGEPMISGHMISGHMSAGAEALLGGEAHGGGELTPSAGQVSGGRAPVEAGLALQGGEAMTAGEVELGGALIDAERPSRPMDMGPPSVTQEMGPSEPDMSPPEPDMSPPEPDMGSPYTGLPASLRVYTANLENLPRTSDLCPGDWRDLYAYMSLEQKAPDLFLVQQLSGLTQMNTLLSHMSAQLGRTYAGLIAEESPTAFNSPCGAVKDYQTNAIIYDVARFSPVGESQVWQSYRNTGQGCELNTQSRAKGIAQAFIDLQSGAQVAAASIHWSTANGSGPDPACAVANSNHTQQVFNVHFPSASLYLWGGDSNEEDTVSHDTTSAYRAWYQQVNRRLGGPLDYMDVIWDSCQLSGDVRACLLGEWTFKNLNNGRRKRIDFLFTKASGGALPSLSAAHTVSFREAGEADLALTGADNASVGYSDHRAVWAELTYSP